jgi:hypothetical protein
MNRRTATLLAASALLVGACNGWPTTRPYEQAVNRPEKYITYTPVTPQAVPMFYAGNHRYMVMPTPANVRGARTASVPSGQSVSVFALEGDEAPFANLFARQADGRVHAVAAID